MKRGLVNTLLNLKYAVNIEWKTALCSKLLTFQEGPQDSLRVAETS